MMLGFPLSLLFFMDQVSRESIQQFVNSLAYRLWLLFLDRTWYIWNIRLWLCMIKLFCKQNIAESMVNSPDNKLVRTFGNFDKSSHMGVLPLISNKDHLQWEGSMDNAWLSCYHYCCCFHFLRMLLSTKIIFKKIKLAKLSKNCHLFDRFNKSSKWGSRSLSFISIFEPFTLHNS